jgi:UDP-glucuronate 4-epimerase
MRYLVSGAAGFIGARIAEMLVDQGHQVVGVDNLNDAYDVNLKEWRLGRLTAKSGFSFHKLDILDREALDGVADGPAYDGVFNLAARAGVRPSVANPWVYAQTNILGALNVMDWCRRHGVAKLVQASTSSLYGRSNERPFAETADTSRPLSPYAASKGAAEMFGHAYAHLHQLDISVLRFFTVYGPAGRPDMSVFRFIQWIAEGRPLRLYGDGNQQRDYTYIDDIARGAIAALRPTGYEVINLGGDEPVSILDVIHRIETLLEKPARIDRQPVAPGDVPATWADIGKAKELLDWSPQVALDDGLQRTVSWYLQEREWARQVDTSDI